MKAGLQQTISLFKDPKEQVRVRPAFVSLVDLASVEAGQRDMRSALGKDKEGAEP